MSTTRITILALAMAALSASPAGAAETTAVSIDSATSGGGSIVLAGTLAYGDDATGPITVGEDPEGDAAVSGGGLDFGRVDLRTNPSARTLTWDIQVYDMPPAVEQSAPFFGYTLPISVDSTDTGAFLAAGNAGASFPPSAGPFYQLCSAPEGSYSCPTNLSGSMGADGITITLPYFRAGIQPGSDVSPGAAAGCGGGICSTLWAGVLFNATGGDTGFLSTFRVPGEVKVGIAPAGTPPGSVTMQATTTAETDGSWTAAVAAPASPGDYVLVARSCWGAVDTGLTCAEGTSTITI